MAFGPTLTSVNNPTIKYARSLHQRKVRYRERALLVEGARLVLDTLATGAAPRMVFVDEERAGTVAEMVSERAPEARVHAVSPQVLASLADTETPQGVVAVFSFPDMPLVVPAHQRALLVVADALRDPGNLGTLIRSALGAGAHAVYLTPESTDAFGPKALRAGMSAQFRIPIRWLDWSNPDHHLLDCPQRLAAEAGADVSYDSVDWMAGSCVVIGNEAHGLSPEAAKLVTGAVGIPLAGQLESLNAAVAGSIVLFEAARQRRAGGRGIQRK